MSALPRSSCTNDFGIIPLAVQYQDWPNNVSKSDVVAARGEKRARNPFHYRSLFLPSRAYLQNDFRASCQPTSRAFTSAEPFAISARPANCGLRVDITLPMSCADFAPAAAIA